jgi:putative phosphoesterase
MLIGLLSDTHIPDAVLTLPSQLKKVFSSVELILHAGDIFVPSVLDELESIAPVLAAEGDSDYLETRQDRRVRKKHILNIEGLAIWLFHDEQEMLFKENQLPDIIVYGHTHAPYIKTRNGSLLVCPGSPTYPDYKICPGTVGILEICSGKAEATIIQLD